MTRKKYDADFKAKIALEAIKSDMTIAEISNRHSIAPTQIKDWKSELLAHAGTIFTKENKKTVQNDSERLAILEQKIGQLTIENDFLKKNLLKFPGKTG